MKTIFCVDNKWGLGRRNGLLFDLKEDMRHFVAHTKGKVVVMGANTLKSLPNGNPLKGRTNIVLNPDGDDEQANQKGYILVKSLKQLFDTLKMYDSTCVYVIGGAMLYRTLLPYCDTAIVTKVDADGNAEVFHPNLDTLPNWQLQEQSEWQSDSGYLTCYCTYTNLAPTPIP